jgi:phytoene synthase
VYALLAEWRALTDPATEPSVAGVKLAWWREEMQRLVDHRAVHPIGQYLEALPRAQEVDFASLATCVEAAAAHVQGAPIERSLDLATHARLLMAGPFGVSVALTGEIAAEAAPFLDAALTALATAENLARALADFRREARVGRIPFPIEELLAARIENADLVAATPPAHLASYLERVRERARHSYREAAERLPREERGPLRHLLVLAALGIKHLNSRRDPQQLEFRLQDLYLAWSTARRAARS